MGCISGKTVIIRGVIQEGSVGFGIAEAFAREGASIALVARGKGKVSAVSALERHRGCAARPFAVPNPDEPSIAHAVSLIAGEFRSVDVLVNCSLFSKAAPLEELTSDDLRDSVSMSAIEAFMWMRACHSQLASSKGCIINLVSRAACEGAAGFGSLALASEGLRGLTRVAATEWGPEGIGAFSIEAFAHTAQLDKWAREFPEAHASVMGDQELSSVADVGELCIALVKNHVSALQ